MDDPGTVLALEPEDLDGHTVEELDDYLDRGCTPPDPSIDGSPSCQIALAAMTRLRRRTLTLLLDGQDDPAPAGEDWIGRAIARLPLEARRGRRFPIPTPDPAVTAAVTEGALRGLVRAVGDDVPGFLTGSVRILTRPDTDRVASLRITGALVYGFAADAVADALRAALRLELPDHAPFDVETIDVEFVDVIAPRPASTSAAQR